MESLGRQVPVEAVTPESFEGVDFAFFSAGSSRSKQFAPFARQAGAVVIDNSSAFRMDQDVPLVVPEVNFHTVKQEDTLIANPNCSTIILLMGVAPLRALGKIRRVIVSTYQSASGAGAAAMRELEDQSRDVLQGKPIKPQVMPHPYAFNLFSHNSDLNELGYNGEEWKMMEESRKILGMPDLLVSATCVRVPVLRAHSESVTVEFDGPAPDEQEAREALAAFPGVRLVDDRAANHFPMPLEASGAEEVLVGRIRKDASNPHALCLFLSGDQLLKGAALNAVQIAERMIAAGYR